MQHVYQQLTHLKLSGIQDALVQQTAQPNLYNEQSVEERLRLLLAHELTQRQQRKIERLTRQARCRVRAEFANINYQADRNINKAQLRSLAEGEWLRLHQNLLMTGATGCGKTYLACARGHHYCQKGISVYYARLKQLLENMYLAQAEGSYRKVVNKLSSINLLVLDDWGLEPLNAQQRSDLLEIIDARYETNSTLITSQLPIENWHVMIGESTHADAILDRLIHRAIKLELEGDSMRKKTNNLTHGDHLG